MRRATIALAALVLAACEAVPSIDFELDAAAADGAADATSDADGSAADAPFGDGGSLDGQCPTGAPSGSTCCGTIWCVGANCSKTNCDKCETMCPPGEVCCSKNPLNLLCRPLSQGCPP